MAINEINELKFSKDPIIDDLIKRGAAELKMLRSKSEELENLIEDISHTFFLAIGALKIVSGVYEPVITPALPLSLAEHSDQDHQ